MKTSQNAFRKSGPGKLSLAFAALVVAAFSLSACVIDDRGGHGGWHRHHNNWNGQSQGQWGQGDGDGGWSHHR